MTCSDYLPGEWRDCGRPARYIVEVGGTAYPKCDRHARRYRHPVGALAGQPVTIRPIEAAPA